MTLQSFKNLNTKQKRKMLLQRGVFLADRTTDSFSVFLFHMGEFFVELFFIKENDEVVGMRSIKQLRHSNKYKLQPI
jgi:hypothetical protein